MYMYNLLVICFLLKIFTSMQQIQQNKDMHTVLTFVVWFKAPRFMLTSTSLAVHYIPILSTDHYACWLTAFGMK